MRKRKKAQRRERRLHHANPNSSMHTRRSHRLPEMAAPTQTGNGDITYEGGGGEDNRPPVFSSLIGGIAVGISTLVGLATTGAN